MRQLQLIPLVLHGSLGYVLGALLVLAPFALHFDGDSPAMVASVVAGVLTLAVTLLGKGPVGAAALLPLSVVEGFDYTLALGLVLLPFLLGLVEYPTALLAYDVAGLTFFVLTLAARFPRKTPATGGEEFQTTVPQLINSPPTNGAAAD